MLPLLALISSHSIAKFVTRMHLLCCSQRLGQALGARAQGIADSRRLPGRLLASLQSQQGFHILPEDFVLFLLGEAFQTLHPSSR